MVGRIELNGSRGQCERFQTQVARKRSESFWLTKLTYGLSLDLELACQHCLAAKMAAKSVYSSSGYVCLESNVHKYRKSITEMFNEGRIVGFHGLTLNSEPEVLSKL